jgi:hypothetical protein
LSGVETPTSFAKSPKPAHSFCTVYNKFSITKPDLCRILKFPSNGGVSAAQNCVQKEKLYYGWRNGSAIICTILS